MEDVYYVLDLKLEATLKQEDGLFSLATVPSCAHISYSGLWDFCDIVFLSWDVISHGKFAASIRGKSFGSVAIEIDFLSFQICKYFWRL